MFGTVCAYSLLRILLLLLLLFGGHERVAVVYWIGGRAGIRDCGTRWSFIVLLLLLCGGSVGELFFFFSLLSHAVIVHLYGFECTISKNFINWVSRLGIYAHSRLAERR